MSFIHNENQFIHYRDDGAGVPVVALHGSASTGRQWESLTGYLSGQFRVIRPDLPGYGKSSPAGGDRMSLGAIVDRLSLLFGEIGEPFHLVGHSFGGAVALEAALAMPDMIRSLVVIEPASFHLLAAEPAGHGYLAGLGATVERMRAACDEGDAGTAMGHFVDFWNGDGAWARTSHELRARLAQTTGQVMDDFLAISAEAATFADHAAIDCPVLAIAGRRSPVVTRYLTGRLARAIATAKLVEIADAGHMAPLTDPHVVDPLIGNHVAAASQPACTGGRSLPLAA